MSFVSVLKKIGAVIAWPFTHAEMLVEFFADVDKDFPATKAAIVGTVSLAEKLGPDAIGALAEKGLDVPADLVVGADLQAFFAYIQSTLFPTIQKDYTDFKLSQADAAGDSAPAAAAPAPAAAPAVAQAPAAAPAAAAGPGLSATVPA